MYNIILLIYKNRIYKYIKEYKYTIIMFLIIIGYIIYRIS